MFAHLDGACRKRCWVWVNEGGGWGPPPLRRGVGSPPLQPPKPAMGIVTQWAIRLQTSDFYGPSPPTPNTQAPHDRPPPPPQYQTSGQVENGKIWNLGKRSTWGKAQYTTSVEYLSVGGGVRHLTGISIQRGGCTPPQWNIFPQGGGGTPPQWNNYSEGGGTPPQWNIYP